MRAIYLIMGLIALLQVCLDAEAAPANPSLSFYVISKDKINDGRFIDSPEFPKLGYISDKPRLVIVRLKSVLPGTREDVLVDKEGRPNARAQNGTHHPNAPRRRKAFL